MAKTDYPSPGMMTIAALRNLFMMFPMFQTMSQKETNRFTSYVMGSGVRTHNEFIKLV